MVWIAVAAARIPTTLPASPHTPAIARDLTRGGINGTEERRSCEAAVVARALPPGGESVGVTGPPAGVAVAENDLTARLQRLRLGDFIAEAGRGRTVEAHHPARGDGRGEGRGAPLDSHVRIRGPIVIRRRRHAPRQQTDPAQRLKALAQPKDRAPGAREGEDRLGVVARQRAVHQDRVQACIERDNLRAVTERRDQARPRRDGGVSAPETVETEPHRARARRRQILRFRRMRAIGSAVSGTNGRPVTSSQTWM